MAPLPLAKTNARPAALYWTGVKLPLPLRRVGQIDVCSKTKAEQQVWLGWCEARMRKLVQFLEVVPQLQVHPFPDSLPRANGVHVRGSRGITLHAYCNSFFVGMKYNVPHVAGRKRELDLSQVKVGLPVLVVTIARGFFLCVVAQGGAVLPMPPLTRACWLRSESFRCDE